MKSLLSLALIGTLTCSQFAVLGAQAPSTGEISGSVSSSDGQRRAGIAILVLSDTGAVVGKGVTVSGGNYTIPGIPYGKYTVQALFKGKVIGTSLVTLSGASASADLVVATAVGFWSKWGLLTGLGAAATAIGAVAVIAASGDASGAR